MKKNILIVSIICLFLFSFTFTYSSFKNVIVGNITATVNNWKFILNVPNGTKEDGYYKVNINNTSGSFDIILDSTGSKYDASYIVNLIPVNLDGINIDSLKYEGTLSKNSKTITVNYSSENTLNGYIMVKAEGRKIEYAIMKNGSNIYSDSRTAFWSDTYREFIKTITFSNDVSNVPSSCTEDNLCFDLTDSTSSNQVYGYLVDSGDVDSSSNTLYDLNIVSKHKIYAPTDCYLFFAGFKEVESINFNNNFDTSNVTNMSYMFHICSSLDSINLTNFDTSNVTNMSYMFYRCSSLDSINLNNFNTINVTDMRNMFDSCSSLTDLNLSSFNTVNLKNMAYMFFKCSGLQSLDLSNFNTLKVTNLSYAFSGCSSLLELDLSSFNTINVTDMTNMFSDCSLLSYLDLSGFNTSNVVNYNYYEFSPQWRDGNGFFHYCSNLTTTINIMNADNKDYNNNGYLRMFEGAATNEGAKITVNYVEAASDLVESMIASKSSNSNVVKGSIIVEPTIIIENNTDIKYSGPNRQVGTVITLETISGEGTVSSFRMNGTVVNGNTFNMIDTNVVITDIVVN